MNKPNRAGTAAAMPLPRIQSDGPRTPMSTLTLASRLEEAEKYTYGIEASLSGIEGKLFSAGESKPSEMPQASSVEGRLASLCSRLGVIANRIFEVAERIE